MGQTMGMDLNVRRDGGAPRFCLSRLAWVPIPVLLTALGVFWAADWQRVHPSVHLLLIVNIVLTLLACLVVAYLITRSFLIRSTPGLLLLGCGVVLWGPAGVVATIAARGDANLSITIYNSCVWLSALCHLAGVALSVRSNRPLSPPMLWLVGGYACAAGAVALVTLLALAGWIPAFYVEERGATFARQVVLASALGMCALAALLLGITRRRSLSGFAYWYALALLLLATGLLGVMLQTHHASVLGWTGRMTQALGALYLFVAAVACVRESRVWGMSMETALQESEGRYRTLFETAPDAVIVHRDGRFLRANDAALWLSGAGSFEELAGHGVLDFFRPPEREQAAVRIRLAQTGHPQPIREATLRRLGGQEMMVELHTGPIDFQGAPAVQTIIRDVTERKQAEAALRREAQVLAQVHDSIIATDLDGHITFWNQGAERQYGYTAKEALGRPVSMLYFPEDLSVLRNCVIAPTLAAGQHELELRSRAKSGQAVFIHLSLSMLRDERGSPCGMIGYSLDITERKRAEELLKIKESAIASSLSAIAMADLQGRLTYVNPAFVKLWAYEDEREILGRPVLDFWKQPERAFEVVQAIRSGTGWVGELVAVKKDGACLSLYLSASTVLDDAGTPICMMASFMDITDRRRAEEALKESEFHLARAQQMTHLGSWSWDIAAGRLYWSDETYRLYGLQPGECVPRHEDFLAFVHPEDRPRVETGVREALAQGGSYQLDFRIVRKGGEERYVHCEAQTLFDAQGHPTRAEGALQDITERKRAEEALKQSLRDTQQRWAEVSALMTCTRAVLDCRDLVSTTRTVFTACRELLGAPAGYVAILSRDGENNDVLLLEAGGLRCTVDPSLPMPVRGLRGEAYRTGRVVYENDFAQSHWAELLPPGHVRLENVLFAPLVIDGRAVGLLGLGNKPGGFTDHDATLAATFGELVAIALRNSRTLDSLRELNTTLESKVARRTAELAQRARQLQKLTLELSQAEERERRRVAVLLHEDLQQHIAGAKFHLNLLRSGVGDEARRELVPKVDEMLREAIEKSRSLSHDLSPAVLHLNDLGEVLEWLTVRVQAQHGLTVHADICGDIALPSEALTVFLFRAAQEVLSNVVKHAGVKEATLRVRRLGRHVCLCISDTGRGFDLGQLKDTNGFGLLGIRERVELLGGRMKIRSFEDRGTAVRIVVPEAPETVR